MSLTPFLFGCLYVTYVFSLQVIPERAELYYVNDLYLKNVVLNVRRLGRRGATVVNVNFTLLYEASNNVTFDIIFFEYLHNEYKQSFVEMHFNVCHMLKDDKFIGLAIRNAGMTGCPVKPDTYVLRNMAIPNIENFPYVWPYEKAKVMGNFSNPKSGVVMASGSVFFTFKQKKISNKKP